MIYSTVLAAWSFLAAYFLQTQASTEIAILVFFCFFGFALGYDYWLRNDFELINNPYGNRGSILAFISHVRRKASHSVESRREGFR
jgi:hypothetical protein